MLLDYHDEILKIYFDEKKDYFNSLKDFQYISESLLNNGLHYPDVPCNDIVYANNNQIKYLNYDNDIINHISTDLFKFCIIPIGFNNHQTTTIIFIEKEKMYLYILNSGLDINYNGNKVKIDSQDLYQLIKN